MINVGVISLGRMGMLHLTDCMKIDDVRVVAAADSSKIALKSSRSSFQKKGLSLQVPYGASSFGCLKHIRR